MTSLLHLTVTIMYVYFCIKPILFWALKSFALRRWRSLPIIEALVVIRAWLYNWSSLSASALFGNNFESPISCTHGKYVHVYVRFVLLSLHKSIRASQGGVEEAKCPLPNSKTIRTIRRTSIYAKQTKNWTLNHSHSKNLIVWNIEKRNNVVRCLSPILGRFLRPVMHACFLLLTYTNNITIRLRK